MSLRATIGSRYRVEMGEAVSNCKDPFELVGNLHRVGLAMLKEFGCSAITDIADGATEWWIGYYRLPDSEGRNDAAMCFRHLGLAVNHALVYAAKRMVPPKTEGGS